MNPRSAMRPVAIRLLALISALFVALPSVASTRAHYFCHAMDRVLPACCCEHEDEQESHETGVRAADCCDRLAPASRSGLALRVDAVQHVPSQVLLATLPAFELPAFRPSTALVPVPRAQAPPREGQRLFLLHCSLLT
ncbi:MAG TPA: hypothetical protein VFQ35_12690 [Polyangiaceae bacterium]|nr:hypothetical protein [Polyangiaceae bacterium]